MLIDCMLRIFDPSFYEIPTGKIVEIKNSENKEDLKKVFVDCSEYEHVLHIKPEPKKGLALCTLFQCSGHHMKTCDGIIVVEKQGVYHAVFCELKTSWDPKSIHQIRNTKLLYDYAASIAQEWHNFHREGVHLWFAVLCKNRIPIIKYSTKISQGSIPNYFRPSKNAKDPQRMQLDNGRGQNSSKPIKLSALVGM